jgi:LmbE family N-acetylglucosaminyl deacetylase
MKLMLELALRRFPINGSMPFRANCFSPLHMWLFLASTVPLVAQPALTGSVETQLRLKQLQSTASVLHIAAHPDDEATGMLAYFSRGLGLRTGYLSLTRGEGGQNLIGTEQGALLGLIRTQELLEARRVDGAQQFFTRAIDFGYSKTPEEALRFWGKDAVLGDVVWAIRSFQPDIIVTRFQGNQDDGHGHHQASAILAREAFDAAADPKRYPEQLKWVKPWQAKRLVWLEFNRGNTKPAENIPGRVKADLGDFNALIGASYEEIAGFSRSLHRSQGMGSGQRKGAAESAFRAVAGAMATQSVLDGVAVRWSDVKGGSEIGTALDAIAREFRPAEPWKSIPGLIGVRRLLARMDSDLARRKLAEADELIARCAGLWLDASASTWNAVPGSKVNVTVSALNRSPAAVRLESIDMDGRNLGVAAKDLANNRGYSQKLEWGIDKSAPVTQPYWLRENPDGWLYRVPDPKLIGIADPLPSYVAKFRLTVEGEPIVLERPLIHRWVDKVYGELTRPFLVTPPVSVSVVGEAQVFPNEKGRAIVARVESLAPSAQGTVELQTPSGWKVEPASAPFTLTAKGQQVSLTFQVTPPPGESRGSVRAVARIAEDSAASVDRRLEVIEYPHITTQTSFLQAAVPVARANIRVTAKRIGYIEGAGDLVPESLRQLGLEVEMLDADALARGDLSRFDAIVAGVRAFNTRADLRANRGRLLGYVQGGGTFIVQYNTVDPVFLAGDNSLVANIGPYPLKLARDRVSEEDAEMRILQPDHALLNQPNKITAKDFEGWVQERGLYYAGEWAPQYTPLFSAQDRGEKPLEGGTLVAKYGQGTFIYTGLSWFRQLPAGVPGAYRLFANFLSASKTGAANLPSR